MRYFFIFALVFGVEFFIKEHMDKVRTLKEERPLWNGRITLKKYYNTGSAGNFLDQYPKDVKWINGIVLGLVLLWLLREKDAGRRLGFALIAAGGFSNLVDRLRKGHVVDYVSFGVGPGWFRKLVFNMADFSVFLGILFVVRSLWKTRE